MTSWAEGSTRVTTSRTPIEHVEGECTGARETRDGMPAVGSKYVRCMCHGKERLGGWCMVLLDIKRHVLLLFGKVCKCWKDEWWVERGCGWILPASVLSLINLAFFFCRLITSCSFFFNASRAWYYFIVVVYIIDKVSKTQQKIPGYIEVCRQIKRRLYMSCHICHNIWNNTKTLYIIVTIY